MWVYGDAQRSGLTRDLARRIADTLADSRVQPAGLARHAALTSAFVDASELIQGLIDVAFHKRGFDASSPDEDRLVATLFELARIVERSWRSDFRQQDVQPELIDAFAGLGQDHAGRLTTRSAEGYSIYALYPETYLDAAYRSGLGPDTIVVGIRSIGLSLSCLVAAAINARPPISLRPTGDPFARRVEADPKLLEAVVKSGDGPIAIVDEGPGLSGSSFFAVVDWLESGGVARDRIHFFPSHYGEPGGQAAEDHRRRWREAPRHVSSFDALFMEGNTLRGWVSDGLGPFQEPLRDLSWGGWQSGDDHAPVDARLERRKFLAQTADGSFLAKFAGLGSEGQRKFKTAGAFYEAGFGTEPIALLHGMIVERWVESQPLHPHQDRTRLIETLARYLSFRATTLPAHNEGASLAMLADVAAFNVGQAFGSEAEALVRRLTGHAASLQPLVRPVDSDNRLHSWEWRVLPDGRLIKTDALDHSSAHDLVGCQDSAWDVAGAIVEHDLTRREASDLLGEVGRLSGREIEPDLLALLIPCYVGFQTGLWTMAHEAAAETSKPALQALLDRYKLRLSALA